MNRATARASSSPIGAYSSPIGGTILSVRLSAKCNHDQSCWKHGSCGHCFCSSCNGYVSPVTKVCGSRASNLVTCNRKKWDEYERIFGYVGEDYVHSPLSAAMKKVLTAGKCSQLGYSVRYKDENDTWEFENYEHHKTLTVLRTFCTWCLH